MRFSFLHAADLHIDSPLAGLGLKDPAVAQRFARAGRRAVENLVDLAVNEGSAFVIIAGDVFDGDWKDYASGQFFARVIGRLHRAGIPTLMIRGNHDADNLMTRSLTYPPTVRTFEHARAETVEIEQYGVAIHGRSYGSREPPPGFVASYPPARRGFLNIGILHTALNGAHGHASYAPCTPEELARFEYDYWALGHVHGASVLGRQPWIVFPGNVQGRSVRETGPKGAMRVTVDDGRIVSVEPIVLDAARWASETVDVSGCETEAEVLARIEPVLADVQRSADARPLAVRITLTGRLPLHARLVSGLQDLQEQVRALGSSLADDCWVERVRLETGPPARPPGFGVPDGIDLESLLVAAAEEPEFDRAVAELIDSIGAKLPRDLAGQFRAGELEIRLKGAARDYLLGLVERRNAAS